MSVTLYCLRGPSVEQRDGTWVSLDASSLELPRGVFTTLRTHDAHRIVGLSAHLQRLVDSLRRLGSCREPDLETVRAALAHVIHAQARAALRLRVTIPLEGDETLIAVEPFEPYPPELYERGAACATIRLSRDTPQAKSTAFLAPSRHAKALADPAIHELLLVADSGEILEGTTSNFFAVLGGVLRTAGSGVLEGVTRGLILALGEALLPVDLSGVTIADLPALDEAFITSSSREVMPVTSVDRVRIGDGNPGRVTRALAEAYRDRLELAAESP